MDKWVIHIHQKKKNHIHIYSKKTYNFMKIHEKNLNK